VRERCITIIEDVSDTTSVVRFQRFTQFDDQWLGEAPQYFQKRCAATKSLMWRTPEDAL
jgi:hypothetical protein